MSYLVDTNVFGAVLIDRPNPVVETWLAENEGELYTSSITIAEISFGVEQLPLGRRRTRLQTALDEIISTMGDRILRFDTRVALIWGKLRARLKRRRALIQVEDSYIAAVAERHNLTVATRKTRDFQRAGVRTVNPFES